MKPLLMHPTISPISRYIPDPFFCSRAGCRELPGGLLELVEHPVNVPVARLVLRRPGDHARRVFVVELQRVGHRGHGVRIAAQHRHVVSDLTQAVRLAQQVVGRGLGRARPAREELNQHRPRPARATPSGRAHPSRPRYARPKVLGCETRWDKARRMRDEPHPGSFFSPASTFALSRPPACGTTGSPLPRRRKALCCHSW